MRPFFIILSLLFISCNQSSNEPNEFNTNSSKQTGNPEIPSTADFKDSLKNTGTELYIWHIDFYSKTKKKNPGFKIEYLNADSLIKGLNELYPDIKLNKVKMSGDTLFTEITDSDYFTERMGSSGAALYITDVVINLTSVKQIRFVKIDFDMGSHASPGVWSAKDFSDYQEIH